MTTPSRPPLWEEMQDAGSNAPGTPRDAIAAEIRAIAEEAERRGALGLDRDPSETADWLRAEADRAECGEVEQ